MAILLCSDLPQVNSTSSAPASAAPSTAVAVAPTRDTGASPVREPFEGSSATRAPLTTPAANLCLVGVFPGCASSATAVSAGISPAASRPSSWTNITPKRGQPNPTEREEPATVFYPTDNDVILFGGWGVTTLGTYGFLQDTWAFSNDHWTELIANATCTNSTCPSPRSGAMLAYDAQSRSLILFGGYIFVTSGIFGGGYVVAFNDTWQFSNGTWTNLTLTAGAAPPARFEGTMTYDSSDNDVLLFGGMNASQDSIGDTWTFSNGQWTELTFSASAEPTARGGAGISDSPSGYVMLFGGADSTDDGIDVSIIQNNCNGGAEPYVAWWFYEGVWSPMDGTWFDSNYGECIPQEPLGPAASVHPAVTTGAPFPPCGREYPAVGWSPKNNRFVIYGGFGPSDYGADACGSAATDLNDTFSYALAPGGYYEWNNASYPAGPPARMMMGSANDFADGYFEIFGGYNYTTGIELNSTWRFYEIVYAKLTGPNSYDTSPGALNLIGPYFTVDGYGGTGDLDYKLTYAKIRNTNSLTGTAGCSNITGGATTPLPYNGTWTISCYPKESSFNVIRVQLTIIDEGNSSHPTAEANWTWTIIPPEDIGVYSQFVTYFYQGVSFENTFTIITEVGGLGAKSVAASIGGYSIGALNSSDGGRFWNVTLDTAGFSDGTILHAEAQFGNWTLNTTDQIAVIDTPSWLLTLFKATGATQHIDTQGAGPWNRTYTINEQYQWSLNTSAFSIPVTLVGGTYGLLPSVNVMFSATSDGHLSITGTLGLSTPSISIGPVSLQVTAALNLTGTFSAAGGSVTWASASASITVSASITASIPIYGFSILGCNIGFTLQLAISPSVTIGMILAPATSPSNDIINGVALEIQKLFASFTLALSAAINFGIGIASVGLGVGLSVAVAFEIDPFRDVGGWVNGSVFVTVQFLWWSDNFNIIGPDVIYSWGVGADSTLPVRAIEDEYDNGTGSSWTYQVEYYKASDYDQDLWTGGASQGPAISDIYPWTEVTGAAAYNGADLFYTDDNTTLPESAGLLISAAHLSSSSNSFSLLKGPTDSNDYEMANPQVATLGNGDLYVTWVALPNSEADAASPLDLTSMWLQGAVFYPSNGTWGPVRTFSSSEFAESYQVDSTGSSGVVLELLADRPLLTNSAAENLIAYNLTTGAVLSNVSLTDWNSIVSYRSQTGLAVLESLGGNDSLLEVSTGTPIAFSLTPPADSELISASFAQDSATVVLLLYRTPTASELYVYDAADGSTLASLALGPDALQVEGIVAAPTTYFFVRSIDGLEGWSETAGTVTPFTNVSITGLVSYGLVQSGDAIVLYSVVDTGGNATQPIRDLELAEFGAPLGSVPVPAGAQTSAPSSTSSSTANYLLYLVLAAVGVILVLAVIAVATRRKSSPPSSPPSAAANEDSPAPPPTGGAP